MTDTAEGIGSRKWSYQVRERDDAQMVSKTLVLSQGVIELAALTADGERVKHLLVTAPQLWAAANAVIIEHRSGDTLMVGLDSKIFALAEMVAKAVGKQAWEQVEQ
jgi:hypothetical protein